MRLEHLALSGIGPFQEPTVLDLTTIEGLLVAVVGPNGAGKSTLLESFAAALHRRTPTRGTLADLATSRTAFVEARVVNGRSYTIRQTVDAHSGKGEALVLDAGGAPVLADAKLRSFDAWAKAHLPPAEVLFASTFAAQGSGGFIEMTSGERKEVLLRALGIERLEALSGRAREHAREAKEAIKTICARLADEQARGGDVVAAEEVLEQARAAAARAEGRLQEARAALGNAQAAAMAAREAGHRYEAVTRAREELLGRLQEAQNQHAVLVVRQDEAAALLACAGEIRRAVAELAALNTLEGQLTAELTRHEDEARRATREASDYERRAREARRRKEAAEERAVAQRRTLEGRIARIGADIAALGRKVAKNREELLDQADAIRAAEALTVEIVAEERALEEAARRIEREHEDALREVARRDGLAGEASGQRAAARGRAARAEGVLSARPSVDAAAAEIPGLRAALAADEQELAAHEGELEQLRVVLLSGAERRIGGLRGALTTIAGGADGASELAAGALSADDRAAAEAADAPVRIEAVQGRAAEARRRIEQRRDALGRAERLAARAPEVAAAAAELDTAETEAARASGAIAGHRFAAAAARARAEVLATEGNRCQREISTLAAERERLAPLVAKVPFLVGAEERVAGYEEQIVRLRADQKAAEDELLAIPPGGGPEAEAAEAEALAEEQAAVAARQRIAAAGAAEARARGDLARIDAERARLSPIADEEAALAKEEAFAAERATRLARASSDVAAIEAQLTAMPEPPPPPTEPQTAAFEAALRRAEGEERAAHAALVMAEGQARAAREAAGRIAALEEERRAAEQDLADWTRLAEDLGRDGLQALEIDCAGPELTELVNDLLRSCVGPRWTVSIEATRLSADGKRELEGCEVRVLDTVKGREAGAETFSAGERVLLGEAVSLALSMIACRRAGVDGPTLIRDESGAALDPENARAYVAMLRRAAEIVGASKVLFVSHSPEVQELADARIAIRDGRIVEVG